MRGPMVHAFSQIPQAQIPRSSFDRSHGHKTTLDAGLLVPVFIDEALPGDTFSVNMTGFCRLATPLHPFMDNLYMNSFFFAVPIRLIWENWAKFNGEQESPGDSTDFLVPQMVSPATTGYDAHSLSDYFGLPTGIPGLSHCSFWHRAYNLIWNEWFRDQNLQAPAHVDLGDGPDDPTYYALRKRGKRHDYFTSCLPWPQKGESVSIPLGTSAPVLGIAKIDSTFLPGPQTGFDAYGAVTYNEHQKFGGTASASGNEFMIAQGTANAGQSLGVHADLSNATAATINQLRQAFQVQRLYERDARGGSRYIEIVRSHFGVVSPDARMQRPEYLGGGQSPVNLHVVPQTSGSPGTNEYTPTPQGNLAAYGTATLKRHGFSKSFTEHCVIIGLVSVRADLGYSEGMHRMFSRKTRFDFYWPALSHIGEQAVLNKEIYVDGTPADEEVWGYQERHAEYRFKPSMITGQMRSNHPTSLDTWHLAQDFGARPLLNQTFIQENPPIDRVVAVPSEPHFIGDFYFQFRAARPMPVYGVPGMMDHF